MLMGKLPRISCLRKYARLSFNLWLSRDSSANSVEQMCSKLCLPEKSKWAKEGFLRFFQFKEDHGGSQGLS